MWPNGVSMYRSTDIQSYPLLIGIIQAGYSTSLQLPWTDVDEPVFLGDYKGHNNMFVSLRIAI